MKRLPLQLLLLAAAATAGLFFLRLGAPDDERTVRYLTALATVEPPGALPAPKERADWEESRLFYRAKLTEALGLELLPDRPIDPRTIATAKGSAYRVERLRFDPFPEMHGLADLYLPLTGPGPFPALVFISSADEGLTDIAATRTAATLAAAGTATLVLELPGCGDRRTTGRSEPALFLSGVTPAGVAVRETRLIIEAIARRPDIDRRRLAVAGAATGGMTALYAAALDDTVAAGAAILALDGLSAAVTSDDAPPPEELLIFPRRDLEQHHILALAAPRPFLVIAGKKDIERTAAATETVRRAREIYRFLGADERLELAVAPGARRYQPPHRALLYDFLTRAIGSSATGEEETDPDHAALPVPFDASQELTMAELSRREALLLRDEVRARRDLIGPALYAGELAEALRDLSGAGLFSPDLPAALPVMTEGNGAAVLFVGDIAPRQLSGILDDARTAWGVVPLRGESGEQQFAARLLTVGLPLAILRADDIAAAAEALAREGRGTIGLYASGPDAGLAALLAAHRTEAIGWLVLRDLTASLVPGIGDTGAIQRLSLQVPRLLRTADIGDLIATLTPRPVMVAAMRGSDGLPLDAATVRRLVWETRHLVIRSEQAVEESGRFLSTRGTTPTP